MGFGMQKWVISGAALLASGAALAAWGFGTTPAPPGQSTQRKDHASIHRAASRPSGPERYIAAESTTGVSTGTTPQPGTTSQKPKPGDRTPKATAPNAFVHIQMMNAQVGWAIGKDNLWRTTDSGTTWHDVTPSGDSHALFQQVQNQDDFCFLSPSAAWMVGGQHYQYLYRTTDGGHQWKRFSLPSNINNAKTGTVTNVDFVDNHTGWMVISLGAAMGMEHDAVYRTNNGGQHWTLEGTPTLSDSTGLAAQSAQQASMGQAIPVNKVVAAMMTDGGTHWKAQDLPSLPGYGPHSPYQGVGIATAPPVFFSPEDGVMAVVPGVQPMVTVFYTTQDGGKAWTPGTPVKGGVKNLTWSFAGATHGFVSDGNTLYATTDGGKHWATVQPNISLKGVTELDFISPQNGWAIVRGQLLITHDGGRTWSPNEVALTQ